MITISLDWEIAFNKIHQGKLVNALRRIGIIDKVVRVIEAIYRNPKFSVKEMGTIFSEKAKYGNKTGVPTIPLPFRYSYDSHNECHRQPTYAPRETYPSSNQLGWRDMINCSTQTTL